MSEKILLIDGHSILNRAFYGLPDLTNGEGIHTGAVYGFLNILFRIDKKVVELVRRQHEKALQILQDNIGKLHELAKYLYEQETITGDEFMRILNAPPLEIQEKTEEL